MHPLSTSINQQCCSARPHHTSPPRRFKGGLPGTSAQPALHAASKQHLVSSPFSPGRLKGTLLGVSSQPCMPLSVEGQAHRLIEEASNKDNLGMMYIW